MEQLRFDVCAIQTLEDVIHAVTNSLSLISSHSQYLLGKRPADATSTEELQVIYEEAGRAASLLSLVPRSLAKAPVQEGTGRDVSHGKRRR